MIAQLGKPPSCQTQTKTPSRVDIGQGFTLLEMLVVLALIAAIAGIALPNFGRFLESFSANTAWREVEAELGDLPYRAFASGRALRLDSVNVRNHLSTIPANWQIAIVGTIVYRESGWCEGGNISIASTEGAKRQYVLVAPRCEAKSS